LGTNTWLRFANNMGLSTPACGLRLTASDRWRSWDLGHDCQILKGCCTLATNVFGQNVLLQWLCMNRRN